METLEKESLSAEAELEGPSASFVLAVSELLETDPEDILSELGYRADETGVASVTS
jgi:hypothetical protein